MSKRPGVGAALARKVYTRDGHACRRCGRPKRAGEMNVHHIVAVSDGGTDDLDNLVALCSACHREWHAIEMAARIPFETWLAQPPARLWSYLPPESWPDDATAKDVRTVIQAIHQDMKDSPDFYWPAPEPTE